MRFGFLKAGRENVTRKHATNYRPFCKSSKFQMPKVTEMAARNVRIGLHMDVNARWPIRFKKGPDFRLFQFN